MGMGPEPGAHAHLEPKREKEKKISCVFTLSANSAHSNSAYQCLVDTQE